MVAGVVVIVEFGVEEVGEQQVGDADLSVELSHAPLGAREAHVVAAPHRVDPAAPRGLRRRSAVSAATVRQAALILGRLQLALSQAAQHQRQLLAQRAHLHSINIHNGQQQRISDSSSLGVLICILSIFTRDGERIKNFGFVFSSGSTVTRVQFIQVLSTVKKLGSCSVRILEKYGSGLVQIRFFIDTIGNMFSWWSSVTD